MLRKDLLLALYFFFVNDLLASLLTSVSCSLYTDDLTIWFSSPPAPAAAQSTQGSLIRLKRWSEHWCLPLNPRNMKPHSCQWIPITLTYSPIPFYSTAPSLQPTFEEFQVYLGSFSTALFPFLNKYLCQRPSFSLVSKPYPMSLLPHAATLCIVQSFSSATFHLFFSRIVFFP